MRAERGPSQYEMRREDLEDPEAKRNEVTPVKDTNLSHLSGDLEEVKEIPDSPHHLNETPNDSVRSDASLDKKGKFVHILILYSFPNTKKVPNNRETV